jgi:glycosyltransferase involved in cell wall biosynthesis
MRIAMLGLRGIPAKSGGVEVAVENLSVELVKSGAEVTVYCRSQYCPEKPEEYKGVKLKYLPTINTKFTEAIIHTLITSINSMFKNYDIVHYHAMGNTLFSFMPRIAGKKTVLTLHGLDYEREKWGAFAKSFLKLNEKLALHFPNKIISVSEKIQRHFKESYNKDITYIPNGVNNEKKISLDKLKRFNIKPGYFLSIGRIVPEKGLHFLIEAFKGIKTNKQLVIAGDPTHTVDYVNKLKESAKDDKRIIFTGPLYGEDKQEAYSNAFTFILSSSLEGMPIVLLEAMSYGLYPVISDIEENIETAKGHAILFKSKDADDLREKLNYIIRNPLLIKKNSASCIDYVKKKFTWDSIAQKHLSLYKEVLNG